MHHEAFEWHEIKARTNLRKHAVDFTDAARALSDPEHLIYHVDRIQDHPQEERWFTLASDPMDRNLIYAIVWTERIDDPPDETSITRIISARLATPREGKDYAQRNHT